MTDLGTLGGPNSVAYGINDNGQVVGHADGSDGQEHAFLYSGGTMQDLGLLGGLGTNGFGDARSINNEGQVVGGAQIGNIGPGFGFLYSGGTMADLGTLGGSECSPEGINDNGQVVGSSYLNGDAQEDAFLYSGGTMTDLGALGSVGSAAFAINNQGQVVGFFAPSGPHAFIYSGGTMTDLNSLIPATSGWLLEFARAINDNGQIAGSGAYHAFLLTPIVQNLGNVQILSVEITNTDVVLSFSTISNALHDVQSTTDLVSGAWSTVATNIRGSGVATNYTDFGGGAAPRKFYRVSTRN
jgi:probable HAF family extracellular repeat protein